LIEIPVIRLEDAPGLKVVKERPENFVGKTLVVFLLLFRGQEERLVAMMLIFGRLLELFANLGGIFGASGSDPDAAVLSQQRFECADETAAGELAALEVRLRTSL
jgi:hypothetical protein